MMGETVEQRPGQALRAERLGPFVEGKIRGDEDRRALVALRHEFEQQLRPGLRYPPVNPCSSRRRSKMRFAVCRCLRYSSLRSPRSHSSMSPVNPSSFGRRTGAVRRYPGGTEN